MPKTEKPKAVAVVKTPKHKGGRPRGSFIKLTIDQKKAAINYVLKAGLWKVRLTHFLRIDLKTLNRILNSDKDFSLDLEAAEAEFAGNNIAAAKPEFILKTKYKDEFPEETKIGIEHSIDEKLLEFLDKQMALTNTRRRLIDDNGSHQNTPQ